MSVEKIGKRYRAKTYLYGKQIHLGVYDTRKEAEQVVEEAKRELLPNKEAYPRKSLLKRLCFWRKA